MQLRDWEDCVESFRIWLSGNGSEVGESSNRNSRFFPIPNADILESIMVAHIAESALDRLLVPLTACFTPEVAARIVELRPDANLQARLDVLADKANQGTLTAAERLEYEEYVEAFDIVGILKAKARLTLNRHS